MQVSESVCTKRGYRVCGCVISCKFVSCLHCVRVMYSFIPVFVLCACVVFEHMICVSVCVCVCV